MGKGGDNKVKETAEQRELAKIAVERWQRYKQTYLPAEQIYFDKVDYLGSERAQQKVAGAAGANVETAFGRAIQGDVNRLTTMGTGVDPASGKFQDSMADHTEAHGRARAMNVNESQQALQDSHIRGLQNIVAMGNNQSTQAIQGMGNIAQRSAAVARNDAQLGAFRDTSRQDTAGALAGAGYAAYTNTRDDEKRKGGV